ncbi:hypothetical protein DPMN_042328 [Dreissena polymorpha]|uniref:Uncharacterized protein n=1 Tax=Dreissena polymorpha TaxID=45954 RepID=A0A9D4D0L8_DREPO|nr:hypothetical protein DPMN_042328 [Dreissena polymorpha]
MLPKESVGEIMEVTDGLHLEVNVIIKSQIRNRSASGGDGVVVVLKVSCIIFAKNMLSIDVLTKCPICALRSNALLSFP